LRRAREKMSNGLSARHFRVSRHATLIHLLMTRVEITTSLGPFTLELYTAHAPKTCHNFVELARRGYYDGTIVSFWLLGEDFTLCAGTVLIFPCMPACRPGIGASVGGLNFYKRARTLQTPAVTRVGRGRAAHLRPFLSLAWRRTLIYPTPLPPCTSIVPPHHPGLHDPGRRPDGNRPGWGVRLGRQV